MEYIYLVCEYGYEYDDNNYYRVDNTANPRTAYATLEQAEQVCNQLNVAEFKNVFISGDISDYGSYPYIIKDKCKSKADKLAKKLFKIKLEDCWSEYSKPDINAENVTLDQWQEFYKYFNTNWYFVRQVVFTKNDL